MKASEALLLVALISLAIYSREIGAMAPYTLQVLHSNSTFAEHGIWLLTTASYNLGISYYVKALFTILGAFTVFYLARGLTSSKKVGYLAMFLFAISTIAIFYGNFGLWDGESFTPLLGFTAILLLLEAFRERRWRYLIASIIMEVFVFFFWTGGIYWPIVFVIVLMFIWEDSRQYMPIMLLFVLAGFFLLNVPYRLDGTQSSIGIIEIIIQAYGSIHIPSFIPLFLYPIITLLFLVVCFALFSLPAMYEMIAFKSEIESERNAFHAMLASLISAVPFIAYDPQWLTLTYIPMIVLASAGLMQLKMRILLHKPIKGHEEGKEEEKKEGEYYHNEYALQ